MAFTRLFDAKEDHKHARIDTIASLYYKEGIDLRRLVVICAQHHGLGCLIDCCLYCSGLLK
jgi:hypothetical protein